MSYTNYLQLGIIRGRQSGFQGMEMAAGNLLLLLAHGDYPTAPQSQDRRDQQNGKDSSCKCGIY